jgi:hypothetical protein
MMSPIFCPAPCPRQTAFLAEVIGGASTRLIVGFIFPLVVAADLRQVRDQVGHRLVAQPGILSSIFG